MATHGDKLVVGDPFDGGIPYVSSMAIHLCQNRVLRDVGNAR